MGMLPDLTTEEINGLISQKELTPLEWFITIVCIIVVLYFIYQMTEVLL